MQKHGGAHETHNTGECKKYNSDGTPKKGFAGKSAQQNSCNKNTSRDQSANYAQLSAKIAKLEKSNKKIKREKNMSAIAMTRTHLDVMGPVALGK